MSLLRRGKKQSKKESLRQKLGSSKFKMSEIFDTVEAPSPESVEDVLADVGLRNRFRNFLQERVAFETLIFYENVELYEQLKEEKHRKKAGAFIVEEHLQEDSKLWVNIPANVRNAILSATEYGPETFSAAKRSVLALMSSNFFDDFKKHLQGNGKAAPTLSFDYGVVYSSTKSFTELSDHYDAMRSQSEPLELDSGAVWADQDEEVVEDNKDWSRTRSIGNAVKKPIDRIKRGSLYVGAKFRRGSTKGIATLKKKMAQTLPSTSKKTAKERKRPSHVHEKTVWLEIEQECKLEYKI